MGRVPWIAIGVVLACLALLAGAGTLVALNWEPERKLGTVKAPRFDRSLAGGGLSSREIGMSLLIESLQATEPVGHQILADAVDEGVIDEFSQIPAEGDWTTAFRINGGDLRMRFRGESEYMMNYFVAFGGKAEEIAAIGNRYGFYGEEVLEALESLVERTDALLDDFHGRELTIGVPEPDLASQASALASDWEAWVSEQEVEAGEERVAEAHQEILLIMERVASNPSNPGINEYNDALDRLNQALDRRG